MIVSKFEKIMRVFPLFCLASAANAVSNPAPTTAPKVAVPANNKVIAKVAKLSSVANLDAKGEYIGNENRKKLAQTVENEVQRDSRQNFRISGMFEDYEKSDETQWRKIKANKNLVALNQHSFLQKKAQKKAQNLNSNDVDDPMSVYLKNFEESKNEDVSSVQKLSASEGDSEKLFGTTSDSVVKDSTVEKNTDYFSSSSDTFSSAADKSSDKSADKTDKYVDYFSSEKTSVPSDNFGSNFGYSSDSPSSTSTDSTDSSSSSTENYTNTSSDSSDESSDPKRSSSISSVADAPLRPNDYSQDFSHSTNYGGSVISIPLSSQIQVSLLQKKEKLAKKIAPGVEEEVAKEKAWDVYLSDDFARKEKEDKEVVRSLKTRKEYKE